MAIKYEGNKNNLKKANIMALDENEFFRQATLRICSSLNFDTAIKRCKNYLQQYLPVDGMTLGLYEPEKNILRISAWSGPPHLKRPGPVISAPDRHWTQFKQEYSQKRGMMIINDMDKAEPLYVAIFRLVWSTKGSILTMELELENEKIGGVSIYADGKHRYTENHCRLLSLLHEPFAIALSNMLKHQEVLLLKNMLEDDNRYLNRQLLKISGNDIVGADFGLKGVMELVRQVAPMDSPVLLLGETGSGKEVIANVLHASSYRKDRPFVKVNCGAIPEGLVDSELFGHEKGAFTGALGQKRGRFERAHTGTIFLDEIGELPAAAQVRLLRVLQNKKIERVGGTASIPIDVRIISATHRNLEDLIKTGKFREDLWFRLNVFPIMIPPLRHRPEDIPALANHFIEKKATELRIANPPSVAAGELEKLKNYDWPGNVRELENLVERALIQSKNRKELILFSDDFVKPVNSENVRLDKVQNDIFPLDDVIATHIKKALKRTRGKIEGKNGAALMLRLHPSTLRGKMRKMNIINSK